MGYMYVKGTMGVILSWPTQKQVPLYSVELTLRKGQPNSAIISKFTPLLKEVTARKDCIERAILLHDTGQMAFGNDETFKSSLNMDFRLERISQSKESTVGQWISRAGL